MKNRSEQVLEAALRIFAKYGYKKATVEDIAGELDLTKGSLYSYAKDKKDLYEQAVRFALGKWQSRVVEKIRFIDDPAEQFRVLGRGAFEYLQGDDDLHAILMMDPSIFPLSPDEDRFSDINRASMDALESIIRKGVADGTFRELDVESTVDFIFSVYIMFIIKTYVKSQGKGVQRMFDAGMELLLNGLLGSGTGQRPADISRKGGNHE